MNELTAVAVLPVVAAAVAAAVCLLLLFLLMLLSLATLMPAVFAKKTLLQQPTIAQIGSVSDNDKQKRSVFFAKTGIDII